MNKQLLGAWFVCRAQSLHQQLDGWTLPGRTLPTWSSPASTHSHEVVLLCEGQAETSRHCRKDPPHCPAHSDRPGELPRSPLTSHCPTLLLPQLAWPLPASSWLSSLIQLFSHSQALSSMRGGPSFWSQILGFPWLEFLHSVTCFSRAGPKITLSCHRRFMSHSPHPPWVLILNAYRRNQVRRC